MAPSKLCLSLASMASVVSANIPAEVKNNKKTMAKSVFTRANKMMKQFDLLPSTSHSSLLKAAFTSAVEGHDDLNTCKSELVSKQGVEKQGDKWQVEADEAYENCAEHIGNFFKNDLVRECNERHAELEEKNKLPKKKSKTDDDDDDEESEKSQNVYKAFSAVVYNLWEFPKEEAGFLESLPVFGSAFAGRKRPARGALVAKKADKYLKEPDVVVFTEAWNNMNVLINRMKMHGYKYYIAPGTKSAYITQQLNSGVLVFSKHKIVDFDQIYFDKAEGHDAGMDKGAVFARLKVQYNTLQEVIEGARDFYYVNLVATQLDSCKEDEHVRDEQVKQLNRFISQKEKTYDSSDNGDIDQINNKPELFLIAGSHGASAEQVSHWSAMLHFDEHKLSQYGHTFSKDNEMAMWAVNNDGNQLQESQNDFIVNRLSNNGLNHPTVDLDFSQVLMPRSHNSVSRKDKNVWFKDFSDHFAVKSTIVFKPSPVEESETDHDAKLFAQERKNMRKLVSWNASQREAKAACCGLLPCCSGAGKKKEGCTSGGEGCTSGGDGEGCTSSGGCTGGEGEGCTSGGGGCTGGNEEGCTGNKGCTGGGDGEGCTGGNGGCTGGGDGEGCTGNGGGCTGGNDGEGCAGNGGGCTGSNDGEGCTGNGGGCTGSNNEGCAGGSNEGCTGGSQEGCTGNNGGCTGGNDGEGCTGGNGGACVKDESCCGTCGLANSILNCVCPFWLLGGSGKGCVGGAFEDPLSNAPLGVARNAVMESGISGLEVGLIESVCSSTFSLVAIFAVVMFILIAAYVGMKHSSTDRNGKSDWGESDFTGGLEAAIGARPMAKNI